jgi:hypothetical protein
MSKKQIKNYLEFDGTALQGLVGYHVIACDKEQQTGQRSLPSTHQLSPTLGHQIASAN